jgi:hypothetical protein
MECRVRLKLMYVCDNTFVEVRIIMIIRQQILMLLVPETN